MFLATATLVSSAGLTSGLTVLAATVRSASVNSARSVTRVASPPTPSSAAVMDENFEEIAGNVNTPVEVDATIAKNLKLESDGVHTSSGIVGLEVNELDDSLKVKDEGQFNSELKDISPEDLQDVDTTKVDYESVQEFKLSATGSGYIKMKLVPDYAAKFTGKMPLVLVKEISANARWKRAVAAIKDGTLLFYMDHFSEWQVRIAPVGEKDNNNQGGNTNAGAKPTKGGRSKKGSNSNARVHYTR